MRRAGFTFQAIRQTAIAACLAVILTASAFASDGTNSTTFKQPKTLAELLALPPDQLEKVDIAVMDLLCAEGLPGSEKLDVEQLVKTLDSWAQWVGIVTKQNYHRFVENPAYFHNSIGDYRMGMLATTVQEDFGVRYNPVRAEAQLKGGGLAEPEEVFFANSKDVFIHGLLADNHYGTCASMPVLFVAVAQRLGYPVKLASTKGHFYVRYEEGDRYFNVEATSPGYSIYPDEHYKNWPAHLSDEEIREHHFLQPLNGREMLADFLSTRAVCLRAAGKLEQAEEMMAVACKLAPHVKWFKMALDAYDAEVTNNRNKAKWERLQADIAKIELPDGDNFASLRDEKIALHFYLMQTGDLDGAEKALARLKGEIAVENLRDTGRINLSTNDPHSQSNTVIVLRRVKYLTPGGREIELTEQLPGQMDSLLREQRILDKAVAVMQGNRRASGLPPVPWEATRFSNVQPPPDLPPEAGLKQMEDRLDDLLKSQQEAEDAKNQPVKDAPTVAGGDKDLQAALALIDRVNALGGNNRTSPAIPSAFSLPQINAELQTGIPPGLQNIMNLVDGMGGGGHDGSVPMPNPFSSQPALVPNLESFPPETQAALKQINETYELKRQMDLLRQATDINSAPTGKAQK